MIVIIGHYLIKCSVIGILKVKPISNFAIIIMINDKEITAVGKFQKTHALKGELNAILDIDAEYITEGHAIIIEVDGIYIPFFASTLRPKGNTSYLVKLDGVDSEQEAKMFVNKTIYALKSELAPFLEIEEEDLRSEDDLMGYEVIEDKTNTVIGKIEGVDSSTQNLLFIIKTPDDKEIYVPAVEEFIIDIDDRTRKLIMRLPDGLLELN